MKFSEPTKNFDMIFLNAYTSLTSEINACKNLVINLYSEFSVRLSPYDLTKMAVNKSVRSKHYVVPKKKKHMDRSSRLDL